MSAKFIESTKEIIPLDSDQNGPGAIQMIAAYQAHSDKLKIEGRTLNGFKLPREDIEQLMQRHPGQDLMLMFAVNYEDVADERPQKDQSFTVIMASIDGNGRIDTGKLMNKFKPCPDHCAGYEIVFPQ